MCIYLLRKVREKIHTYFQKGENNTKYIHTHEKYENNEKTSICKNKHDNIIISTVIINDINKHVHDTCKPPGETPIVSTITLIVTDYNGGNSTAATFSVVRKGPKKKSKYELWKEKQRL